MEVLKRLSSCCFILLLSLQLSSQDKNSVNGAITMLNGDVIECHVRLPIGNYADNAFKDVVNNIFVTYDNGEQDVIKSDDVDSVVLTSNESSTLLKRSNYNTYKLKGAVKTSSSKAWLQQRSGCEAIRSYVIVGQIDVGRDGSFWEEYVDGMTMYLLQRDGEKNPTQAGVVFLRKVATQKSFDKQRKGFLEKYFANDKQAYKTLIEGKKLVTQDEVKAYLDATCN